MRGDLREGLHESAEKIGRPRQANRLPKEMVRGKRTKCEANLRRCGLGFKHEEARLVEVAESGEKGQVLKTRRQLQGQAHEVRLRVHREVPPSVRR